MATFFDKLFTTLMVFGVTVPANLREAIASNPDNKDAGTYALLQEFKQTLVDAFVVAHTEYQGYFRAADKLDSRMSQIALQASTHHEKIRQLVSAGASAGKISNFEQKIVASDAAIAELMVVKNGQLALARGKFDEFFQARLAEEVIRTVPSSYASGDYEKSVERLEMFQVFVAE